MTDISQKIDYFCLNQELVKISHERPNSRCVRFVDIQGRKRAEEETLKLIVEYPEFGDLHTSLFRTIPTTVMKAIADLPETVRAEVIKVIVRSLRAMESPVTGEPYTGLRTITTEEWPDFIRIAKGEPPLHAANRSVRLLPSDRQPLLRALNIGIKGAQDRRNKYEEKRLRYIRSRLTEWK